VLALLSPSLIKLGGMFEETRDLVLILSVEKTLVYHTVTLVVQDSKTGPLMSESGLLSPNLGAKRPILRPDPLQKPTQFQPP
jgi:hypothetical protein